MQRGQEEWGHKREEEVADRSSSQVTVQPSHTQLTHMGRHTHMPAHSIWCVLFLSQLNTPEWLLIRYMVIQGQYTLPPYSTHTYTHPLQTHTHYTHRQTDTVQAQLSPQD